MLLVESTTVESGKSGIITSGDIRYWYCHVATVCVCMRGGKSKGVSWTGTCQAQSDDGQDDVSVSQQEAGLSSF